MNEVTWVALQTQSVDVNFCCKSVGTFQHPGSCCVLGSVKNLHDKPLLSQDPSFPAFGRLGRTMEALTLQRHQLTVHASCVLVTLTSTKTGKRTGEAQSVIIEDCARVNHQPFVVYHCTKRFSVALVGVLVPCHLPCSHRSFGVKRLSPHTVQSTACRRHNPPDGMLCRGMAATTEK